MLWNIATCKEDRVLVIHTHLYQRFMVRLRQDSFNDEKSQPHFFRNLIFWRKKSTTFFLNVNLLEPTWPIWPYEFHFTNEFSTATKTQNLILTIFQKLIFSKFPKFIVLTFLRSDLPDEFFSTVLGWWDRENLSERTTFWRAWKSVKMKKYKLLTQLQWPKFFEITVNVIFRIMFY